MKVTLINDDGREFDVTEHFQVMYDNLVGSMNWGSGFLDGNDALIVMQAGAAAGFEVILGTNEVDMLSDMSPIYKAFPDHPTAGPTSMGPAYYALKRDRAQWIKETFGDPITWDSITAYRERLQAMEDSDG